jgi:hypothetical protein
MPKVSYLHGSARKTRLVLAERRSREVFQAVSSVIGDGPDLGSDTYAIVLVNRENGRTAVLDFNKSQEEAEGNAAVYNDAIRSMNAPFPWFIKISKIKVTVK